MYVLQCETDIATTYQPARPGVERQWMTAVHIEILHRTHIEEEDTTGARSDTQHVAVEVDRPNTCSRMVYIPR